MSLAPEAHDLAAPRGLAITLAAIGPVAIGALLAARSGSPTPVVAVPAIVFGVVAATSPALYIATAATGAAPALSVVIRAFGVALGAFGVALAGLLLPAVFLSLSSIDPRTMAIVASGALAAAAYLALRRLARELHVSSITPSLSASVVFLAWSGATLGIAGRLWWDLAREVIS